MVDARAQLMPGFKPESQSASMDQMSIPSPDKIIAGFKSFARRLRMPNLDPIRNTSSGIARRVGDFIEKHPIASGIIYGVTTMDAIVGAAYWSDPTMVQRGPDPLTGLALTTALGVIFGAAMGMGEEDSRQYRR